MFFIYSHYYTAKKQLTFYDMLVTSSLFDPRTVQPVAQSLYRLSYPAHSNLECNIYSTVEKGTSLVFTVKMAELKVLIQV
jgi:hypothetical protein